MGNVEDRRAYSASLRIDFSNDGDGIQSFLGDPLRGSRLLFPYEASIEGYADSWLREDASSKNVDVRADQNYIFRIRSVIENGEVKKALYGKIRGDIRFDVFNSDTALVDFTYYVNPDGTTNLEFDPERNLFTGLGEKEVVKHP